MNWANQVRGCMSRPEVRFQVFNKPDYVIKGNPGEILVVPIEIKNVG